MSATGSREYSQAKTETTADFRITAIRFYFTADKFPAPPMMVTHAHREQCGAGHKETMLSLKSNRQNGYRRTILTGVILTRGHVVKVEIPTEDVKKNNVSAIFCPFPKVCTPFQDIVQLT